MKKTGYTIVIIVAVIAFAAGFMANSSPYTQPIMQEIRDSLGISNSAEFRIPDGRDFVPANISIAANVVTLQNGCHAISFPVTSDQALSISQGLTNNPGMRPLTHDILKDVIDGFNLTVLNARIERFDNDIYYARMFVQQGNKIMDIDLRPSDVIALSLRTRNTLYMNSTMLNEQGINICTGGA